MNSGSDTRSGDSVEMLYYMHGAKKKLYLNSANTLSSWHFSRMIFCPILCHI